MMTMDTGKCCQYRFRTKDSFFSAAKYILIVLDLPIGTYSDHIAMEESIREPFFDAIAERIDRFGGSISVFDTIDLQHAGKP